MFFIYKNWIFIVFQFYKNNQILGIVNKLDLLKTFDIYLRKKYDKKKISFKISINLKIEIRNYSWKQNDFMNFKKQ